MATLLVSTGFFLVDIHSSVFAGITAAFFISVIFVFITPPPCLLFLFR